MFYLYCFDVVCYMFVNDGYIFLYIVVEIFVKFFGIFIGYYFINWGVIINFVYLKEWFFKEMLFVFYYVSVDENFINFVWWNYFIYFFEIVLYLVWKIILWNLRKY